MADERASGIAHRYRRRADAFEATVAAVDDDGWDRPSPCPEWNARDVVRHIVDMHHVMLRSYGRQPTAADVDADPLGAFRAARADVEAILEDPVLAGQETESPAGTTPSTPPSWRACGRRCSRSPTSCGCRVRSVPGSPSSARWSRCPPTRRCRTAPSGSSAATRPGRHRLASGHPRRGWRVRGLRPGCPGGGRARGRRPRPRPPLRSTARRSGSPGSTRDRTPAGSRRANPGGSRAGPRPAEAATTGTRPRSGRSRRTTPPRPGPPIDVITGEGPSGDALEIAAGLAALANVVPPLLVGVARVHRRRRRRLLDDASPLVPTPRMHVKGKSDEVDAYLLQLPEPRTSPRSGA